MEGVSPSISFLAKLCSCVLKHLQAQTVTVLVWKMKKKLCATTMQFLFFNSHQFEFLSSASEMLTWKIH